MRRTPLAWAATAVLVVLALSGCGRVATDIAVHEDGTYDMTTVMAASETELETAGQTAESFTSLLIDQFASQPGIEDFVVSEYQQDGYAGVEITGENIPGDDVGMFGRGVISTDDDGIHFDLQYPITIITGSFTPEQTEAVEIRTTVSFPSKVTDHNGTLVDDVTVEWTGNGSADLDYTATSAPVGGAAQPSPDTTTEAADEPTATATPEEDSTGETTAAADVEATDDGSGWVLPLALGLGVLVLAGLGTWLVLRNRKNGGQGGPGGQGGSGGPGAYASSQAWGYPGQQGQSAPPQDQQPGQQPWGQPQPPQQPGQPGQQWGPPPPPPQPGQPDQQWGPPR